MVSNIVHRYYKMVDSIKSSDNLNDPNMSVPVLLSSIREMMQTRRMVGVVLYTHVSTVDPFVTEWGPSVSDSGTEIYARIYPPDTKSISISNVWNGCLVAFKARTSEDENYSYSLMILVPWNLTSTSEYPEAMCEERIRRGLDPACSLKSNIIPVYGITQIDEHPSSTASVAEETASSRAALFKLSNGHRVKRIKIGSGLKITCEGTTKSKNHKANDVVASTMQVASVGGFDWMFAAIGKKTDELDAIIEQRSAVGSLSLPKGKNVHLALHEHLSTLCDTAAEELFGGDGRIPMSSIKSACCAVRLMLTAQTSFLRTIPMLRPCLPYSMTNDHQLPLLLAICVHIALNPTLFSLNLSANMCNCTALLKEMQGRVGVINMSNELPLDAIIATIISSTQCEHALSLPAMQNPSRTVDATVGLYSLEISPTMRMNLTDCAAVGLNIVNTFYGARCRVDKKSHDVRNYFNGLTPVDKKMNVAFNSTVFDSAHAFHAEALKNTTYNKPPPIPPWPLSLIPESKFHRMIVMELLEPLNHYARQLLNSSFDVWIKTLSDENGLSMFSNILRRGWQHIQISDCTGVLISDQLYSTCVKCNHAIHSCEYAIPFDKAQCRMCHVRMCYKCIKTAGPIASMGFLCNTCADSIADLGDSSSSSGLDDDENQN